MDDGSVQTGQSDASARPRAFRLGLFSALCLLGVLIGAFVLRSEGIHWPKLQHPDEQVIVKWIKNDGPARPYAGGFFVMMRPVCAAAEFMAGVRERFRYHTGAVDDTIPDAGPDLFMRVRWFNVWLGTLSCLLVFLLARRITGSAWGGVLAAALMASSHYPVEHSHYAETDIAMLFVLTVGLWLWATAMGTDRRRWLILAALALGFAAGTKFLLFMLWPPFLAGVVAHFRRQSDGVGVRSGRMVLAALLLAAGFFLANPGLPGMDNIATQLWAEKSRLGLETAHNMGELAGTPSARWLTHILWLGRFAMSLGWGWLVLSMAAVPLLFSRPMRRYGTILIGVPVMLSVMWVFMAPWVRSQEFLAYMPILAVAAALAAVWMHGRPTGQWRLAASTLAVLALLGGAIEGMRTASVFGWTDTRVLAERWLTRHEPADAVYMMEWYAWVDAANPRLKMGERKIEETSVETVVDRGAGYLLRNRSYEARGMLNPLTGRLFPGFEAKRQDVEAKSEPLKSWSTALYSSAFTRSRTCSGFTLANSQDLGLYGLRVFPSGPDFDLSLSRPARVSAAGRESFCPDGRELGSDTVLQLDRGIREFAIGGPVARMDPVCLVAYTRERPVVLDVSGYGSRQTMRLNPYDVRVLKLHRPGWSVRTAQWEKITVRADPGRESIGYIPCFMRVAFSAEDVFRCLEDIGLADRFAGLWPGWPDVSLPPAAMARAAFAAGDHARAERRMDDAMATWHALEEAAAAGTPFRIRGLSDYYHRQFARLRVGDAGVMLEASETGGAVAGCGGRIVLPVECYRGPCHITGEWCVDRTGGFEDRPMEVAIGDGAGRVLRAGQAVTPSRDDRFVPFAIDVRDVPGWRLELAFHSLEPLRIRMRNIRVNWDPGSIAARAIRQAEMDRAELRLRMGQPAEALDILAKVRAGPADSNMTRMERIETARLEFECRLAVAPDGNAETADAARRLRALAPRHRAALQALAGIEAEAKQQLDSMELPAGALQPLFEPYLKLVGFVADAGRIRGVFEAVRDDVPPLALRVEIRRSGKWRKTVDPVPLVPAGASMSKGERVVFEVAKDKLGRAGDMGISVESLVEWHPGRLAVDSGKDGRVTLDKLVSR